MEKTIPPRNWILSTVTLIACLGIWWVPAIPQDPAYHNFADTRGWIGISNFGDVISNVPFALVGILGIGMIARNALHIEPALRTHYLIFFIGVTLVCFGSGYYHLDPDNGTLLWDRLPMTLAFMGLFAAIVAERVCLRLGKLLLWPLLVAGLLSVVYWHYTEQQGQGDLRPYALIQFLPILLIPLIMWLYPARYNDNRWLIYLLGCYLLAKLTEFFDPEIFTYLKVISGHSIKHLAAALGVYLLYRGLRIRELLI